MKKVWYEMPRRLIASLAKCPSSKLNDMALSWCERTGNSPVSKVRNTSGDLSKEVYSGAVVTFAAVGRWLKGQRKLIDLSHDSMELLDNIDWRWGDLPEPTDRRIESIIFCLSPSAMVYMEPLSTTSIQYALWYTMDEGNSWGTGTPNVGDPVLTVLTQLDVNLKAINPLYVVDPNDHSRVNKEIDVTRILRICLNAYAAVTAEPRVVYAGKRRRQRRRGTSGGIKNVTKMRLSIDGMRTLTRRWETEKNSGATDITRAPHSKGLHVVEPHYWRVWVNNPKPDESVLEVREKQRTIKGEVVTYKQYRVKRWRKGDGENGLITRGKGALKTKTRRVVTGVDDI